MPSTLISEAIALVFPLPGKLLRSDCPATSAATQANINSDVCCVTNCAGPAASSQRNTRQIVVVLMIKKIAPWTLLSGLPERSR